MSQAKIALLAKNAVARRTRPVLLRAKAASTAAEPGAHPRSAELTSWSDFKRALKMDA